MINIFFLIVCLKYFFGLRVGSGFMDWSVRQETMKNSLKLPYLMTLMFWLMMVCNQWGSKGPSSCFLPVTCTTVGHTSSPPPSHQVRALTRGYRTRSKVRPTNRSSMDLDQASRSPIMVVQELLSTLEVINACHKCSWQFIYIWQLQRIRDDHYVWSVVIRIKGSCRYLLNAVTWPQKTETLGRHT